jgi:prephenate dehydrogenase
VVSGFARVAVVGSGLIGGSVALRLQEVGLDVVVVDPDPATGQAAADAGLAAVAAVPADRDLVVLAAPLDALPAALAQVAEAAPGAVVVDLGSVKGALTPAAAGLGARYVGAHPMAGSHRSGFAAADADLLVGATWAVTYPAERAAGWAEPVADVAEFLLAGFEATVLVTTAEEHDAAVALVSHTPHVLANALLEVVAASGVPAARHLGAGSFGDLTRVGGRDAPRTRNMLTGNAEALAGVLDRLLVVLAGYRDDLTDPEALLARLDAVGVDADVLRDPDRAWTPCDSLPALLTDHAPATVLVQSQAGALVWSTP